MHGLAIVDRQLGAGRDCAAAVDLDTVADDTQVAVRLARMVELREVIAVGAVECPALVEFHQLDHLPALVVAVGRTDGAQSAAEFTELHPSRDACGGEEAAAVDATGTDGEMGVGQHDGVRRGWQGDEQPGRTPGRAAWHGSAVVRWSWTGVGHGWTPVPRSGHQGMVVTSR